MPIGKGGGGEIVFPIGSAAQGIGTQTTGGPLSAPTLKDANQFSAAFNKGQTPITTGLQEISTRINNAMHVDANANKQFSAGENLGNPAFNADNKIAEKTSQGLMADYLY